MKKYWKIAVITAMTVSAIGTFYLSSAVSAKDLPEFVIQKQEGDARLADSIVIEGSYSQRLISRELEITTRGTTYEDEVFLMHLFGGHVPKIGEFIQEHRDFMRGKSEALRSFYEDQHYLIYVNAINKTSAQHGYKFFIDVLDKEQGRSRSFELPIPNQAANHTIIVEDVQWVNGQLKVVTVTYSGKGAVAHIYTVSISGPQLLSDETVISALQNSGGDHSYISLVEECSPTKRHDILVFDKVNRKTTAEDKMQVDHTLIAYDLATKEKYQVPMPEKADHLPNMLFDDRFLYLNDIKDQGTKLIPFDLKSRKWQDAMEIRVPNEKNSVGRLMVSIKDGKVYTLYPFNVEASSARLTVTDIKSKSILFQGKVEAKQPSSVKNKDRLYFYQMTIQ
ncbi:MAG TPA: hypothetical protein VFK44_06700 [Bacillales bacterium]|nr:hypothetical protein [Bacillales bacterium]